MIDLKRTVKKWFLCGILFSFFASFLSAQDTLFIYHNGKIIYRSQVDQIDSAAFHPPGYWAEQRSTVIYEKIQSIPELSIFAKMLDQSGYIKKLDNKTIWAPNNAALAELDLNDHALVRQLLENHISDWQYVQTPISMLLGKVTMINQKRIDLSKTDNDYYLDGNKILTRNINVQSGQINIIDGFIPYRPTLFEYLNQTGTADSMGMFLRSFNKKTYDAVTKDSVTTNELLTNVAASLKLETMEYTVLIPDNRLWNETVNRLMKYYPSTTDSAVIATRLNNVKRIILRDLFVKGRKSTLMSDTLLFTTLGNELVLPTQLFGKDTLIAKLSNGNCLKISALYHLNAPLKEVRVEAENSVNRKSSNANVTKKYKTSNSEFPISNNAYNDVYPLTTSLIQPVWVQYGIPNLLPGKYNIYVVFVPACLEDTTLILPYSAKAYLDYPDANGVTQSNLVLTTTIITAPKAISKILLMSDFVVNFFDMKLAGATNPMVKLKVQNTATVVQSTLYNREIRTDCIIFERVE